MPRRMALVAQRREVRGVVHAVRGRMAGLDVVDALGQPVAVLAKRVLAQPLGTEARPPPAAVRPALTLDPAAGIHLGHRGQLVSEGFGHVPPPRRAGQGLQAGTR